MGKRSKSPILVTGSHRSGSTWAGNMLSWSPEVAYINEPFNILYKPGSCRPHFKYWYTYVCRDNEEEHIRYLRDCLNYRPHQLPKAVRHGNLGDLPRILRFQAQCLKARWDKKRPLVKDPLAVLSTEWLAQTFGMQVVMLVRHPAAFVGSVKKASWPHPFSHFLKQPLLMDRHLTEFRDEIEQFARQEQEIIDQAILMWRIVYSMVLKFREKHQEEWIFIKHEALSRDPVGEFRSLYRKLDLDFSSDVEKKIREYSLAGAEAYQGMKRDSRSNIYRWKERLTPGEIERVREKTEPLASQFYSAEEWG
mgnify:CR=1 FL=1